MTLHAGYPTPIRMSADRYWARWMVGVYWHQVCSYGQPVGSKELFDTTVASDVRLSNVLFFRSVVRIKAECKTSAEVIKPQPVKCGRTCPLDFREIVSPRKKNKEAKEYNYQACKQHRTIPDPGKGQSPSIKTSLIKDRNGVVFMMWTKMRLPLRGNFDYQEN